MIIVSLLIQATQPLLLVFRRSVDSTVDAILADIVLPMGLHYGRPVWLENPRDDLVRGRQFRYSPFALFAQITGLVVLGLWVFCALGPFQAVIISVLVLIGTTLLLDASVGNSAAGAVAFVISISTIAPVPEVLPSFGQSLKSVGVLVLVFSIVYGVCRAGHALRVSRISPFGNAVRSLLDQWWLGFEMWLPLCFVTRYIHGGPAVVREITSEELCWRDVVLMLLRRTNRAIMDVTEIEPDSGLEWELKTCFSRRINLFLMCHNSASSRVIAYLRRALPDATILPNDFRNLDRLKWLSVEPRGPIIIFFEYGDDGVARRVYVHMGVFFGETTLSDYFEVIRTSGTENGT